MLGEPVDLFREALNCYEMEYFMASTLLCRTVLESALYRIAVVKDIEFHDGPGEIRSIQTYNSIDCYLEIGDDYGMIERRAMANYPAISSLISDAQYVREKGNFVAHYSPRIDKGYVKMMASSVNGKNHSSEPIQLWIGETTALDVLKKTSRILQRLMSEVFTKNDRH